MENKNQESAKGAPMFNFNPPQTTVAPGFPFNPTLGAAQPQLSLPTGNFNFGLPTAKTTATTTISMPTFNFNPPAPTSPQPKPLSPTLNFSMPTTSSPAPLIPAHQTKLPSLLPQPTQALQFGTPQQMNQPATTGLQFGVAQPVPASLPTTQLQFGSLCSTVTATPVASLQAPIVTPTLAKPAPVAASTVAPAVASIPAALPALSMALPPPTQGPALTMALPPPVPAPALSMAPPISAPALSMALPPPTQAPALTMALPPPTQAPPLSMAPTLPVPLSVPALSLAPSAVVTAQAAVSAAPATQAVTTQPPAATAQPPTTASAVALLPQTMTYAQLEDSINKWTSELAEQERLFLNQATQINAWDNLLATNCIKLTNLNNAVHKVKTEQKKINYDLDFILSQQKELDACLLPLEKEYASSVYTTDAHRERIYFMAENIDSQLKKMAEDLKETIEHINETARSQESVDPVLQIGKILNAHMNSLQWIDENTNKLQSQLENIAKTQDTLKRTSNRFDNYY